MTDEVIEGYRLSPQQQHLWLSQQADDGPAYCAQCVVLLEGTLLLPTLQAALEKVVSRHEILHTKLQQTAARAVPAQVISEAGVAWGAEHDLSQLDPAVFEEKLDELLRRAAARLRDSHGQDLNLQATLVRRSPESHLLLLTLPAFCADVTGMKNLIRELGLCYEACVLGQEVEDVPVQYADLAEWLSSLQESADTEAGRKYWSDRDVSALPALALPFENAASGERSFETRQVILKVGGELRARIETLAEKYRVSLSDFALACWQVLLWRLTGQMQIVVGIGCEGRSYEGLEEAIGLFAKYLPVHSSLIDDDRFSEILGRVQQSLSETYEWEEYFSWEHLGQAKVPGANSAFFPFSFDVEESMPKISAGGLTLSSYHTYACAEPFNIKLVCVVQDGELRADFHYDSRRFTHDTIRCLTEQFHRLLQSAAADPEAAIGDLNILGDEEKKQLLHDFNDTAASRPDNDHVCQLIEQWAEHTPGRPAVIGGDVQLSYAELNLRANKVAHHLRALGAVPGTLVAICVERAPEMAVGVLGILKAGAAYMPLDPAYPRERVAFMLNDARATLLLTQSHLLDGLPEHTARTVCLDTDWSLIAQQRDENPGHYSAQGQAYVIYTSGSSGEPRGVLIGHDNLSHYAQAIGAALGLTSDDNYLHTASIGFSSSVRQLIVPLTRGAMVTIATVEQKVDPVALFELVRSRRVTIIDLVPSHWRACTHALRYVEPAQRAALLDNELRLILSASEPLMSDLPHIWRTEFKHEARLVNMFGQTETTGIVTVYPIEDRFEGQSRGVPIGRPIPRTRIYLLDERLRPVPLGVEGELYIGGDGLGQGYLNRPDLTAERFIPDPFAAAPGQRLYRTGDAARYATDGNIEFRNRIDNQVKIRGFRVELGEIEAVLASHLAINEAVAVAHDDPGGDKKLVVYIVPEQLPAPSGDGLQSFLRERLPEYMIPTAFIVLEALPLTPNGKLDRAALPSPDQARAAGEAGFVAPRTHVEQLLTEIWAGVLGLDSIGIHDRFFRLGGHSLLATVLISRVRDAFKIDLPVMSLFRAPTVSGLAEVIEQHLIEQADTEVLAGLLQEMNQLSDEEIRARLAGES